MQLAISDLAKLLKNLIPVMIPKTYAIDVMFQNIASEETIRSGVLAYRSFMYDLCDFLINDPDLSKVPKKGKEKLSDETTLTVEFPFVNSIKSVLMNISEYGILSENSDTIKLKDWYLLSSKRSYNKNSTSKISASQMLKCMKVLSACGMGFHGIDLTVKKLDVASIHDIEVTYPENPMMFIGLKALGMAQMEKCSRKNDDILLRCDYRMLQKTQDDISHLVDEFVHPLPQNLENFIKESHHHYLKKGMSCDVELGSLCTQLVYYYGKKPLWRFSYSLHNGYRLVVKTKNTSKYESVVEGFSSDLKEKIFKGYGCDRKSGVGHGNCQKGCEGYRFSLDDSLLEQREEIRLWLDSEIDSMPRKKKRLS